MKKILELIPQRAPIVMVDEFAGIENGISVTRFEIREDNLFVQSDLRMSECGIIEHIAQSAAAIVGFLYREKGEEVPVGYIGSVNKFSIAELPLVGSVLITSVSIIQEIMNISMIEAICRVADREIASCRMKIFLDVEDKAL